MYGVPIFFKIDRPTIMPVLRITGIANQKMPGIENFMLSKAVEIIGKAKEFKGHEVSPAGGEDMKDVPKVEISMRFYLGFSNDRDLELALSGIRKELG